MNKTGNHNLKKQEINIYREIQRNTEMAMKALDAVTGQNLRRQAGSRGGGTGITVLQAA